jgi:hypothetical protein
MSVDPLTTATQNLVLAFNNMNTTLKQVLPVVQSTATTATAGSQTLPANPAGFLNITLPNGTPARVPYYLP